MKRLTQILALSLLLSLAFVAQDARAEVEESSALEAVAMEISSTDHSVPDEATTRPDPVFMAGSDAGGAGGEQAGLVKGESSSLPPNTLIYDNHLCCQVGNSCDCVYYPGFFCNPLPYGCPSKTPPNCG
jgi:hypothetical protein